MSRSVVEHAALEARSQKLADQDADIRKALDPRDGKPLDAAAVRRATDSLAQARVSLLADYQAALVELRRRLDEGRDQDRHDLEAVIEMRQKAVESSARAQATTVLLRKTEERLMKALSALSDIRAAEASASLPDRKRQHGSFSPRLRPRRSRDASRANPLFDPEYYLAEYPDVRASGKDPFDHFLEFGASEGRKPNRMFDCKWYLEQNPDVEAAGVNPLTHYYNNGSRERRDPHPLFLTEWYLRQNPGLNESGADPLAHYLAQKDARAAKRT